MEKMMCPLEVKSLKDRHFTGYGAVFRNVDYGGEAIQPGAFVKSLRKHSDTGTFPVMLWSHRPDVVIGKWHEMREDKHGLYVHGEFADTADGRDVHTLVKMKAIGGMSIGYTTIRADYDKDGVRNLKELGVHEVSLVAMPMNPMAQIENVKLRLSAQHEYVPTEREMEQAFRNMGCSKSVARAMVAKIFDGGESGGTPDDPTGGMPENIDGEVSAAKALVETLLAETVRRAFKR